MANGIVRWDPVRDMVSLRDAMNHLFEESFVRPAGWPLLGETATLAVDVMETKDDVIVKAAVPGIKPEDIDISLTGDRLTLQGEFKSEQKSENANYLRQERRYGAFERTLTLPTQVVADKAKAEFENGLLTLTLPKAEEVKPKSIKVKTK
ncbi:MAG TPA: Hsp20/alpha crystallin family protein [Anaerolineae bacterium]|nr:Hsp20/alpha crystallin family protein [Anaerolineae bacterium]